MVFCLSKDLRIHGFLLYMNHEKDNPEILKSVDKTNYIE